MPQPRTYLVPPRAVAYLALYNKSAQQAEASLAKQAAGAAPEFIKVEGLSLVHEGSDRIVLLSAPCKKLLRLPKEWFQNEAWDTPTPEASPAAPTDCPADAPIAGSKPSGANADGKPSPEASRNSSQAISPQAPKKRIKPMKSLQAPRIVKSCSCEAASGTE